MRAVPLGPSVEFPMGPRSAVISRGNAGNNGCVGWWLTHAGGASGTFGGFPYGATKSLYCVDETQGAGVVLGCGGRVRAVPPGPSVELPMEPRSAVLGG
eukprot:3399628-Pyramimonas_sp.AAC.1